MNKKFIRSIHCCALVILSFSKLTAQTDAAALAAADTTNFSVNHLGGWQLYNSFITSNKSDSVQVEIIASHVNNFAWTQEQYIGKIRTLALLPQSTQILFFNLIATRYAFRISSDGKCYLSLKSGTPIEGQVAVIPIKVIYKK
jgi:hypothetical protein